jgi:hypothetical protein
MSHPLVLGMFADAESAALAARAAREIGVTQDQLSVIARDHQSEGEIVRLTGGSPGAEIEDSRTAGFLGELGAHILAAAALVLPGIGPIVAAGPLAAGLGEAAGHLAGNLPHVLTEAGIDHHRAERWYHQIKDGAILLGAHAVAVDPAALEDGMRASGATDVARATWRD